MDLDPRFLGRTYSDFLFRPQKGQVASRNEISLASRLARSMSFELPVISSHMDSVTESEMARTMALEGGIGIVHRAMSVERQAEMVRRVKRSHSAVIENPLRLPPGGSGRGAQAFARGHHITAILIEETAGSGALAGLLTNRDIPRRADLDNHPVDEFMTPFERLHVSPPGIGERSEEHTS